MGSGGGGESGGAKGGGGAMGGGAMGGGGMMGGMGGLASIMAFHRGGKVRKSGLARLQKGEVVLTRQQARKLFGRGRSKRRGRQSR